MIVSSLRFRRSLKEQVLTPELYHTHPEKTNTLKWKSRMRFLCSLSLKHACCYANQLCLPPTAHRPCHLSSQPNTIVPSWAIYSNDVDRNSHYSDKIPPKSSANTKIPISATFRFLCRAVQDADLSSAAGISDNDSRPRRVRMFELYTYVVQT